LITTSILIVGISEKILTTELSKQLKTNILNLQSKSLLKSRPELAMFDIFTIAEIRSDSIYWLDKKTQ
jgi:SM-20-related protein